MRAGQNGVVAVQHRLHMNYGLRYGLEPAVGIIPGPFAERSLVTRFYIRGWYFALDSDFGVSGNWQSFEVTGPFKSKHVSDDYF